MKKTVLLIFFFSIMISAQIKIPYERYVLPNGLNVILHEDHTTPTVSVNTWYHVGSGHEKPGRTGFAHLFEHLMFEGSKHVPEGEFDRLLEAAGGENNGSTTEDRTNYFEDVPSNALELALYLDSDRMGFLLDAMTPEKVDGQREVVKNERRQSYENRPYGLAWETIYKNLYPAGHPYSWPVIGSMEDLNSATYEDVVEFYKTYYVPNNASLVIAGDINLEETIKLVEKWYGNIPAGKPVPPQNTAAANLYEEKIVVLEDKVQLPRIYITWITPPKFAPGDAEMDILANILSGGKNSRLYQRLVYELQIAQDVNAFQNSNKLSSQFFIIATARAGHNLTEIKNVIQEEINKLKKEPPKERELQRAVNQIEASFLDNIEKVGGFNGKADLLNSYFYYAKNPDYANEDLARYKAISPDDIRSAVQTYLLDNARVVLSIVPKGKTDLAVKPNAEEK
ncbi:MAG: pitrilysin family protein [Melioribacter sp.]|uniref:M16 family metallopeptidase n=1 Tax=Rosettibacter primus TaxID=3111523 RepID=UPI00247E95B5|nr:pitrilysin family protein [Melioribacter sp.]